MIWSDNKSLLVPNLLPIRNSPSLAFLSFQSTTKDSWIDFMEEDYSFLSEKQHSEQLAILF